MNEPSQDRGDPRVDSEKPAAEPVDAQTLMQFLLRLAQALLACGEQTATVELTLRRAASAYGMRRSTAVTFPTAIFVSLHDRNGERVALAEGPTQALRLDQIGDVYALRDVAQRGGVTPREGLDRLNAIFRKPARFGAIGVVVGHTILTVGVALVLMPTWINVLAGAFLGLVVGCLKAFNRDRPVLAVPLPVIAATLVSATVFTALRWGLAVEPLHALVPPLVSFLPGAMLTLGMVEMAYGDMVSGSSRLTAGAVQLVLLAFGLAAGATLAGYSPERLVDESPVRLYAIWSAVAPWIGVVVFSVGAFFTFSAPKRSLHWMLLATLVAFGAQKATEPFVGTIGGGFFGMLAVTPLGYLIHLRFGGPPAMVTFLPSFWLLVPGALSLLSVKYMLSDHEAGVEGLMDAVFAFASIALGTLTGAAIYKQATESLGAWKLQIGLPGKRVRKKM